MELDMFTTDTTTKREENLYMSNKKKCVRRKIIFESKKYFCF